jgi:uncharacterized Fe-S cluster protein YjdI
MRDEKAWLINYDKFSPEEYPKVVYVCPFGAIKVE